MTAVHDDTEVVGENQAPACRPSTAEGAPGAKAAAPGAAALRFSEAEIELLRREFQASTVWHDVFVGAEAQGKAA